MECIVLAGGKGTRLKSVVSDRPKPIANVNDRPFLDYLLDHLIAQGVSKFIFSVGYQKEKIIAVYGDSYKGNDIIYSTEESPLLTGGAIKHALHVTSSDYIYVVNADTYVDINLKNMMELQKRHFADLVIGTVFKEDPLRYGTITCDDKDFVISFNEKGNSSPGIINAGVYLIKRSIFESFNKDKFSFELDFLPLYFNNHRVVAYRHHGSFIDIGIPEDYYKAQTFIY